LTRAGPDAPANIGAHATVPGRTGATAAGRRIEIMDVLRGLGLAGIVQVNIQSYTWGAGDALGYLARPPEPGESVLYFLQATLFEGKFYPIFAFLFGAGMVLQMRNLQRRLGADAAAAMQRRLLVLFALGLAHGLLLYCGDVLSAYAACALVFALLAPARLRALGLFVRRSWALAALSLFVPLLAAIALDGVADPASIPASAVGAHDVYAHAGFLPQLRQRSADEAWQQATSVLTFWPQVVALFGLGALAARLGWLRHPERHGALWRRAWRIGLLAGLPLALLGAYLSVQRARLAPGADPQWDALAVGAGSLLAMAYVAAAVQVRGHPWARATYPWLACVGRLALTNYVLQSLLMAVLLSGWGLGLGATATRAQLAGLALLIFAGQVPLSRWILARFDQGPLEAIWRRCTYG
jgi:uncharacterized protein